MDVAAMSVAMSSHHVQSQASLAVMSNVKNVMEQQGQQLMEMLQQPQAVSASHPSLGSSVDLKV
ncbi:YjfB family protein [Virgibacillus kekensis]|uniref:YjfB family protein n=1 Tax=Virgibacillus kekensis TaxID=202261 RepID=A0ABV9DIT2_9BACI